MTQTQLQRWLLSNNKYAQKSKSQLRRQCTSVSIISGKGGVGKTSVAAKMSYQLSRVGNKVLLIDCDYNLSNCSLKLGIPLLNKFEDYLFGPTTFEDCLFKMENLHIFSGANGSHQILNQHFKISEIIIDIIVQNEKNYDYIIVDSPAGLSKDILAINAYTDQRIVILTPDRSSLTDSYSLIKLLNSNFGIQENLVLANKVENSSQYKETVGTLVKTVNRFLNCRLNVLGKISRVKFSEKDFDHQFIFGEKISLIKEFDKVIKKLSDETFGGLVQKVSGPETLGKVYSNQDDWPENGKGVLNVDPN